MKRTIAFLCSLVMIISLINPAVFAAENVAAINGTESFASLQEAVTGYTEGTIVLQEDAQNVTITRDVQIDLNGYSVEGVNVVAGKLTVKDSKTDDYTVADGDYGKVTGVTGDVTAAEGYLQVGDSFHRVNLQLNAVVLRPEKTAIYYTSSFAGDEVVAEAVETFGVALSVSAIPSQSNMASSCMASAFEGFAAGANGNAANGTLLTGILKEGITDAQNNTRATMSVHGSAYVKTADGTFFGTPATYDLKTLVEAVDAMWAKLSATQKSGLVAMYGIYASAMESWNIPNLKAAGSDPDWAPETDGEIVLPIPVVAENGVVSETVTVTEGDVTVTVPAGTALAEGVSQLILKVTLKNTTDSGLTVDEGEVLLPLDVHVEGIAPGNTQPLTISLGKQLPENLNLGNYEAYHVENGNANGMTLIPVDAEFTAHNQFKYTLDGEVILHMASFSEIALIAEPQNKWNGNRNYNWYNTEDETLYIRNADQLAGFSAIVGGMDGQTADDFAGRTVMLLADIDIGDLTDEDGRKAPDGSNLVFYPIGYYNTDGHYVRSEKAITSGMRVFRGDFDGNGNTISNFYQNTWEMKGDHNWYDASLQYYRDGMGLFGRIEGSTIKNLTIDNFQCDSEIGTSGTIATYADSTAEKSVVFENIAITNCNPRVYNIGNGGIVGSAGYYSQDEKGIKPIVLKNITVDDTNKISALWGSWDVGCGGLMGRYYPQSDCGVYMENCHVAATIDVYNDVCGNYQYYWYRYCGMVIGTVERSTADNGADLTGIEAKNCTVDFGDRHEYYYCEFVKNSQASYTHDYQFSRIEHKELVFTDTNGDGIVNLNEQASVTGCKDHNHEAQGTQVVGGETVLVENNQAVYIPFRQLFGGNGWGIKGVSEYPNIEITDLTGSVKKFDAIYNGGDVEYGTTFKIGELFNGDEKLENVQVFVSPADETSTVMGKYVANEQNWKEGTLTLTGKGAAKITINDYNFCIPTTFNLTVYDPMQSLEVAANSLYVVGTKLQINNVTVSYKNGAAETLEAGEYTVSNYDFSFSGKKDITVSYTEFGRTITKVIRVEVTDQYNSLLAAAKKKTYNINYVFTEADFNVTAIDSSGNRQNVTGWTVDPVDTSTIGDKTVIIRFVNSETGNQVTTSCNVTVYNLTVLDDTENEHTMYWMTPGQYNLNGWRPYWNTGMVESEEGVNGEIASGFDFTAEPDIDWKADSNSPTGYAFIEREGRYGLTIENAQPYTSIGINCLAGYDAKVIAFGYYIGDDMSTFGAKTAHQLNPHVSFGGTETQEEYILFGPNYCGAVTDFTLSQLLPGGIYDIHWVAVFEDGIQHLADWTIKMANETQTDEVFVDTDKPNVNVIVMAGQSNMFGASPITQAVRDKYENFNFSNVFLKYSNINFNVNADGSVGPTLSTVFSNDNFEKYQLGMGGQGNSYFGPETALAAYLATAEGFKDQQWFIIKYAAAGTGLAAQWMNTCQLDGRNVTLTDDMIAYVQTAIDDLEARGYDVQLRSFMWMQGESDAITRATAESYAANEKVLVSRLRTAFAGNATRYAGDLSVAGGGMAFVNGGIASNDTDNTTAAGGPNDWVYAEIVNAGKISNCQQLCSVPGSNAAANGLALATGPLAGNKFVVVDANGNEMVTPTIVNPDLSQAMVNSVYIDTHYLLSKLNSTNEHPEYVGGDSTDWAHYGAGSMLTLGELFASCNHYMMITAPVAPPSAPVTQYTVTFNGNEGTVSGDAEVVADEGSTINLPTATRDGYRLLGWYTAANNGTKVGEPGASYTVIGDVTLYAQWERISYTITVDDKASSISVSGIKTGDKAYDGDQIKFTIQNDSYRARTVTVKDSYGNTLFSGSLSRYSSKELTLTMKASDVTVTITQS